MPMATACASSPELAGDWIAGRDGIVAIVVVGGSAKDVGKTTLVCAIISAFREFNWTAVKITAHDYGGDAGVSAGGGPVVCEATIADKKTDTSRYLAAGARRALLVTRIGSRIPVEEIERALGSDRNVIYESNRIVDVIKPDVCLALMAGNAQKKASFDRLLRVTDAVVSTGGAAEKDQLGRRAFRLESAERLSPELVEWLRERLSV
jgi:hypothetical protein